MGQKRTPTALLDTKGSFIGRPSRAALRVNEPTTETPLGPPPFDLSEREQIRWKQMSVELMPGVAFGSDRLMFALLVKLACKFWAGEPMMVAETAQMIQLSGKFAMNPADRSHVQVKQIAKSELSAFLEQIQ